MARFTEPSAYEVRPGGTTIELAIDADSLDTGNRTRDKHLRAEFFNVAEHPQVRFSSTRAHYVSDGFLHVAGHLEAAGKSVQLALRRRRLEVAATTTVDPRALGMSGGPLGLIPRPVTMQIMVHLSRSDRTRTPSSERGSRDRRLDAASGRGAQARSSSA